MNHIKILGIGSNSLEQLNTSSFVFQTGSSEWSLVDCGADIPRQIARAGIGYTEITSLILTHRHLDHTLGVPYFLFARNLERGAKLRKDPSYVAPGLKVYAERDVWEALFALFKGFHPDVKDIGYAIEIHELSEIAGKPTTFCVGKNITFIPVDHAVPTFGFVISEGSARVFAYSSDTLPCQEFEAAAAGVALLIHEAMVPGSENKFSVSAKHATATQAGEAARRIAPSKALMIHIRPAFLHQQSLLETEASQAAGFEMRYPKEGEDITV